MQNKYGEDIFLTSVKASMKVYFQERKMSVNQTKWRYNKVKNLVRRPINHLPLIYICSALIFFCRLFFIFVCKRIERAIKQVPPDRPHRLITMMMSQSIVDGLDHARASTASFIFIVSIIGQWFCHRDNIQWSIRRHRWDVIDRKLIA